MIKKLVGRSLWYFEYGLKRKDKVFTKKFDEIFYEFYHENDYFQQAWSEILELKRRYKI